MEPFSYYCTQAHGKTRESDEFRTAEPFRSVWQDFLAWCETVRKNDKTIPIVWVGHNIQAFDLNFLIHLLSRYNLHFPPNSDSFFDTLMVVKMYKTLPSLTSIFQNHKDDGSKGSKTLGNLYNAITGCAIRDYHNAAADVQATVSVALFGPIWSKRLMKNGTKSLSLIANSIQAKLDTIKKSTEHTLPPKWHNPIGPYRNAASSSCIPKSGPSAKAQKINSIAELALLHFTDEFLMKVVHFTNLHMKSKMKSDFVDINEIRAAIGLLIALGALCIKRSNYGWNKEYGPRNNFFSDVMPFLRFRTIWSHISFYDPADLPEHDIFGKVRFFVNHVNAIAPTFWTIGPEFALDEYLIPYHGRFCSAKQRLPKAGCREGCKCFACCEANGYLYRVVLYMGAQHRSRRSRFRQLDTDSDGFKIELVVNELIPQEFFGSGRCMYTDNWYTSYDLFLKLWNVGIFCTGVFCSKNKKVAKLVNDGYPFVPIKSAAILKTLPEGWLRIAERDIGRNPMTHTRGTMSALLWLDKKCVSFLTTKDIGKTTIDEHSNEVFVQRRRKEGKGKASKKKNVASAVPIRSYGKFMIGVDMHHRYKKSTTTQRKTARWYNRIVFDMIDTLTTNMYLIAKDLCFDNPQKLNFNFRTKHSGSIGKKAAFNMEVATALIQKSIQDASAAAGGRKNVKWLTKMPGRKGTNQV